MAPNDESIRLLERIDERTAALKEGVERLREDAERMSHEQVTMRAKQDALWSDDNAGLRRIIKDEIRVATESRGFAAREWIGIGIAVIAFIVAAMEYFKP
jgi:hypothetical protein